MLSSALTWLGRQGTRAIAAIVFIAIVPPPLEALLKPFITEAIFALLCIAFLRIDLTDLRAYTARQALVLTAMAWTSSALPSSFGVCCLWRGYSRALVLAFTVFFCVLALTAFAFARAGRERSLVLGLMASQRNMGLMLAVTAGILPTRLGSTLPLPSSQFTSHRFFWSRWRGD